MYTLGYFRNGIIEYFSHLWHFWKYVILTRCSKSVYRIYRLGIETYCSLPNYKSSVLKPSICKITFMIQAEPEQASVAPMIRALLLFECSAGGYGVTHKLSLQPSVGSNILIGKMILQLCSAEFRSILSTYYRSVGRINLERKQTFQNWLGIENFWMNSIFGAVMIFYL